MDKNLKQIKPMICPVCGWEDNGFEDDPDYKTHPLHMSFNERKKWFEEQRKINPKFKAFPRKHTK